MHEYYRHYLIRSWQPEDRSAAAQVIADVLAEYGLGWEPAGADRDVLEVEVCYLDRGGEFWVVEADGKIVGTSAYYPCASTANLHERAVEIRKMYLHPAARRQGLGKYLLQQLERSIVDRGYREIRIETASVLATAVKLYEANCYLPVTEIETTRCDRAYVKKLGNVSC